MVKEFWYSFDELGIGSNDIGELMGFEDGIIPDPFPELIEHALNSAPSICNIKGGYKIFNSNEFSMLFALMPESFCGVSLSESSVMSPIKSVSGIIVIGNHLKQKGYQCHWCVEKNCIYGKIKRQKKI